MVQFVYGTALVQNVFAPLLVHMAQQRQPVQNLQRMKGKLATTIMAYSKCKWFFYLPPQLLKKVFFYLFIGFLEFCSMTQSWISQVCSFLWKGLECKALGCWDGETGQTICWSYSYATEVSGLVSFQKAFFSLEIYHSRNSDWMYLKT